MLRIVLTVGGLLCAAEFVAAETPYAELLQIDQFAVGDYGRIPLGWKDQTPLRPSRNWIVDFNGYLRPTLKRRTGLITYEGYLTTAKPARVVDDVIVGAEFKIIPDAEESFGIVGRLCIYTNDQVTIETLGS